MKIALVNHYNINYEELAKLTIANRKEYCNKHNYSYHAKREDGEYNDSFGFFRFPYLLSLFREYNYDYIHFSGIDSLIMNFNIKIEDWIDSDHDFFLSKETSGEYKALNSDVFIVKNSNNGLYLLEFIFSKMEEYKNTYWREQRVMIDFFEKSPFKEWVKIMPMQSFNSYPWKYYDANQSGHADIYKGHPGDFKLGDFLLHAPGHNIKNRLRIWAEFLPKVIK